MRLPISSRAPLVAASVVALTSAVVLDRVAPPPSADVAAGTEACFGTGLLARELPPPARTPRRWTGERAVFRFRGLPRGPMRVRVEVHGQRSPVAVAAQGQALGIIPREARFGEWTLGAATGDVLDVELRVEPFVGWGGRRLGALLDRVVVLHAPAGVPTRSLLVAFLVPALIVVASALAAGLRPWLALAVSVAVSALQALALWPSGLVRSGYAISLAALLSLASLVALAAAAWFGRRTQGAAPWAFAAVLLAGLVQGVAATSPMMVVSDAEFHANKLTAVARGDVFQTSVTPGDHPFRFPYGVSFYALLAPLAQAGIDRLPLVRWGAALAGLAASVALFGAMVPWGARRAGLATLLLQVFPVTFDLHSYGNLSNVFGQAATVGFFAWWWAAPPAAGALLGATLLAAACLAHLSSVISLVAVCGALVLLEGRGLMTDRRRALALALGLAAAALYYSHFLPLVVEQLPRLADPGASSRSWLVNVGRQGHTALDQWGLPAVLLAALGAFGKGVPELRRGLVAWGCAGVLLALTAVFSPLEVRYLYALTLPLAIVGAEGLEALLDRGTGGVAVAALLLLWQTALAAQGIVEGVLRRYRA